MKFHLRYLAVFIFLFAAMPGHGQKVKTYDAEWKSVEEFTKNGLPQSALKEVNRIYGLAKKENQEAQVIKSLVYRLNLQTELREDHQDFVLKSLKEEIEAAKEPAKSILYALLADAYRSRYESLRWQIMGRTTVAGQKTADPDTWSVTDFMDEISTCYIRSIKEESLLKATRLDPFDAIITKGNTRRLRPTLYDLLVHKALIFFTSEERTISKPAYAFEIDMPEAFADAAVFARAAFLNKDSLSLDYRALRLYQKLLLFHLNDADPAALIDADIQRIDYVYRKSVHPEKEQLYQSALRNITQKYGSDPASAQASFLLAQWYVQKAATYQPYGDTTHRYAAVTAFKIADSVSRKFPGSEGGVNLHNLKIGIEEKQLLFNIEKVNIPAKPMRISVQYKNTDKVYFRIVKGTQSLRDIGNREGQDKLLEAIDKEPVVKQWAQQLPDPKDFQTHRTEVKADPLPVGEYYLVASTDQRLNATGHTRSFATFYVSNISFVSLRDDYFVLHRETGQPLEGVKVQTWYQRARNNASGYVREKGETYTTDKNGYFRLERGSAQNRNVFFLELTGKDDRLLIDEQQFVPVTRIVAEKEKTDDQRMFFFTDRSVYRPGQPLYFKGILLNKKVGEQRSDIVPDRQVTIRLFDRNSQVVDSVRLTTNEFGSVSGKFQLPIGGINGQFRIEASQIRGVFHFSVEEYKRPRYKVDIEEPEIAYKVNDTITVTGTAKAFAGNSIDGAAVKYRVERIARFPYPWRFSPGWWPVSAPLQVTHGEATTDAQGKFTVRFAAIPDKTVSQEHDPVFDYVVYADVTDGSGETRSARQTVSAGYKAISLKVILPEKVEKDSIRALNVRTENMNGKFLPAEITLTVRKLTPETRLIRKRLWERPDQFALSATEFVKLFPNDEYDNEQEPASWKKGAPVLTGTGTSQESGKWELTDSKSLSSGFYEFEFVATGPDGKAVKDVRVVEIVDPKRNELARPAYLWTKESDPVEPGGRAEVKLGTSGDQVFIIQTTNRRKAQEDVKTYRFLTQKAGLSSYYFDVTEEDRGGYGLNFLFVKDNRVFQFLDAVKVPWSNKELHITYGTFRDKTLPGSKETWTLTIAGPKKEKVTAELLAGMYDASLDEFRRHEWVVPPIWDERSSLIFWNDLTAFNQTSAQQVYIGTGRNYKDFTKIYDRLISLPGALDEVIITGYGGRRTSRSRESMRIMGVPAAAAEVALNESVQMKADFSADQFVKKDEDDTAKPEQMDQPVRKDFRETAFFFPQLRSNQDGTVTFSFTMPEALTKWKFQAFSHTKELAFGYSTQEIITQKELMVQPNIPRFVRIGDKVAISTKVVNLSDRALEGKATLLLMDAVTGQSLNQKFGAVTDEVSFAVPAGQSTAVLFPVSVPDGYPDPVTVRITAVAGAFNDGEDNTLPVLTNQMLITETLPLSLRGTGSRAFTFEKLLNSKPGGTLKNHGLTVEYTGNPAWYAVQALPYLMEYPYDCAEQTWNRYYANALAAHIANSSPRIEQIFKTWRDLDTNALLSNLQKNQELKSLLLEETPWVLAAKSEAEQKRNLALLFDLVKMKSEAEGALSKLKQMQQPDGSFPWFAGGPGDRFVTQYILSGIGHLQRLTKAGQEQRQTLNDIVFQALNYLDSRIAKDYTELVRNKTDLKKYTPSPIIVQYLYMRSFFPEFEVPADVKKAYGYFLGRLAATWTGQGKYMQAMTALTLSRTGNKIVANAVIKSLRETAIRNAGLGTYWKNVRRSWWWQEAPIEQHALLVEAFEEVAADREMADGIRTWLLTNKQTNRWESTKATAEACYALLLRGSEWLSDNPEVKIVVGSTTISSAEGNEAGTGYIKKSIPGNEVSPAQGKIELSVSGTGEVNGRPSWGGVYWQYFEDLDKITFSETPLKLKKLLFVETNTDHGPVLKPLENGNEVKVGDKIKVRIELSVDRDMEYVHMKDMRASGLEPVNVISSYKWQGGLVYYESTKDAATNFFFNYLPKGKYVFEYPLNVSHQGDFSNGVTTIQCMYAPEFTAHSEGVRLTVGR